MCQVEELTPTVTSKSILTQISQVLPRRRHEVVFLGTKIVQQDKLRRRIVEVKMKMRKEDMFFVFLDKPLHEPIEWKKLHLY